MRVCDLMRPTTIACSPEDSLHHAAQLMWEHDIGCLPVLEGSRVVGMVTDRDLCMGAYLQGARLDSRRVAEVMSREVRACGPDDDLRVAARRMGESQVRRLPVIANDHLVGFLALNDLALAASAPNGHMRMEEVGATLAAICKRRDLPFSAQQHAA